MRVSLEIFLAVKKVWLRFGKVIAKIQHHPDLITVYVYNNQYGAIH